MDFIETTKLHFFLKFLAKYEIEIKFTMKVKKKEKVSDKTI